MDLRCIDIAAALNFVGFLSEQNLLITSFGTLGRFERLPIEPKSKPPPLSSATESVAVLDAERIDSTRFRKKGLSSEILTVDSLHLECCLPPPSFLLFLGVFQALRLQHRAKWKFALVLYPPHKDVRDMKGSETFEQRTTGVVWTGRSTKCAAR